MLTKWLSFQRTLGFVFSLSHLLLPALALSGFYSQAQLRLVKDINAKVAGGRLLESELDVLHLTSVGNDVYYVAQGRELWRTATSGYTATLVKAFDGIENLINVNGTLFFTAITSDHGQELWKCNGSTASTVLIKDIRPGAEGSSPSSLTVVGSMLYFVANDGTTGREIWKSDGTNGGTARVKDIMRIAGSSNPSNLIASGGLLFFVAYDGQNGYEIWKSNGTSGGTQIVKDLRTSDRAGSKPQQLTDVNGVVFFTALKENGQRRLFKTDGTASGTRLVSDSPYNLKNLTNVNGTLFFSGTDPAHGHELWKSDGTESGTVLVKDLTPGPSSEATYGFLHISDLTTDGKKLYFLGDGPVGTWLWVSDGSTVGTIPLVGPYEVYFTFINAQITPFAGKVYFNGELSGPEGISLMRTDGTADGEETFVTDFDDLSYHGTERIIAGNFMYFERRGNVWKTDGKTLYPIRSPYTYTGSSDPIELIDVNGVIYFGAFNGTRNALWKSDGTKTGTIPVHYFDAPIRQLCRSGDYLYFMAKALPASKTSATYYKLWQMEIATGYTRAFTNLNPQGDDQITGIIDFGGTLLFSVVTPDGHPQLWKSQGAPDNTVLIRTFNNTSIPITHLTALSSGVLFSTSDDNGATDAIWRSKGTASNTIQLKTLKEDPATQRSIVQSLRVGGKLFFIAFDGDDYEVWRTDGAIANTFKLDIYQDDSGVADVNDLTNINGTVYFGAKGNANASGRYDRELWKTNGTGSGTVKVVTFPESTDPNYFIYSRTADDIFVVGSIDKNVLVVLSAEWGGGQAELWKTDGTNSGTQVLEPYLNGGQVVSPEVVSVDGLLYFRTTYAGLWRSDGTDCGTFPVIQQSSTNLTLSSGLIFLTMSQPNTGQELFVFDPALVETPACIPAAAEPSFTGDSYTSKQGEGDSNAYPNPFSDSFTIAVNGPETGFYNARIIDPHGFTRESAINLKYNTEYHFGKSLAPGLYLLVIEKPQRVAIKILKTD